MTKQIKKDRLLATVIDQSWTIMNYVYMVAPVIGYNLVQYPADRSKYQTLIIIKELKIIALTDRCVCVKYINYNPEDKTRRYAFNLK